MNFAVEQLRSIMDVKTKIRPTSTVPLSFFLHVEDDEPAECDMPLALVCAQVIMALGVVVLAVKAGDEARGRSLCLDGATFNHI